MKGGIVYMKGNTDNKENNNKKQLTQLEIDNIIDRCINLSFISRLFKEKLINEKEYYLLQEKIEKFY